MSRLPGRPSENKDLYMEIDETSKPDAGVNLVHLTYYRGMPFFNAVKVFLDFGDIFAQDYKPPVRPNKELSSDANKEQQPLPKNKK